MWLPSKAFDLFRIAKDTVDDQRVNLTALRVERDSLKSQLSASVANCDWLRIRLNAVEAERAQLLSKVYGLNVPVPEVIRANPAAAQIADMNSFSFEHVDEDTAKKMGISHLLS